MAVTQRKGKRLRRLITPDVAPGLLSPDETEARIYERMAAAKKAQDNLLTFAQFMRPDPNDADDVRRSLYVTARPHRAVADALMKLESGEIRRLIINMPPRHGKTEIASKLFLPWVAGRHPRWSTIFGSYNQTYAEDIGRAVREVMTSPLYAQVFPETASRLRTDSQASDRLQNSAGAVYAFAGRGGTITGRGGDLLLCDDPIKDRKEADSKLIRDQLWEWLLQVFRSRMMTKDARICLIQTRWHADDAVGRITDPDNEYYNEATAALWHIVDLPALAMHDDPIGREEGEPLWPERFDKAHFEEIQRSDPRGFAALYQGRPVLPGMRFFDDSWFMPYSPRELPDKSMLRIYVASDHAVSVDQTRDKTCLLPVGVDADGTIWVLPDVWWRHANTDVVVEAMLAMIRRHKPLAWFAERGHISKSIGPFLRKRMLEEGVFASIRDLPLAADKQTRAQSMQGRMAMRRVRFPVFAPWWLEARKQLLQFPHAPHDDFVDALAWIGLGLDSMVGARPATEKPREYAPLTLGAIKDQAKRDRLARVSTGGW
jgi:predicted phage terminase large subunit-like protein